MALLLTSLLALSVAFVAAHSTCPTSVTLAIGCYTYQSWLPMSAGEGITLARLSARSLNTTAVIKPKISGLNPSYLAAAPSALYAANENDPGTLSRVLFTNKPPFIATTRRKTNSSGTTHVSYIKSPLAESRVKRVVFAANYNGAVSSFVKTSSNVLHLAHVWTVPKWHASVIRNPDAGLSDRQAEPHPHQVLPYGRGIVVPDLGSDLVWYLKVDWASGMLSVISKAVMSPGDGPRHGAVHEASGSVLVVNEISLTVAVLRLGCAGKKAHQLGLCSSHPLVEEGGAPEGTSAAAIRVSHDGRFVYMSLRYPDNEIGKIVAFELDEMSGDIVKKIGEYSSMGSHPRDFNIVHGVSNGDRCQSYIAVVNMNSNNLVLIERDSESGKLGKVAHQMRVVTPTAVLQL